MNTAVKTVYRVERVEGHGMSMPDLKMRATIGFDVVHEDGTVAHRGKRYYTTITPRQLAGLKLAAKNMCRRYEAHFARTGERFEVVEKAKRDAALAVKKKADRIAWLKKNIPLLRAELDTLLGGDARA